ncbi:MAG: glutamyl-tRNA reductase [Gemmatimonadota bacterium]
MPVAVVGTSHRTAPIEVRERFYVMEGRAESAVARVLCEKRVQECIVLSTCNRTEYYLHAADPGAAERAVTEAMAEQAGLSPERAAGYLYDHTGRDCVVHLFRVTCGIDSLVLGEHQIQGQVKTAYLRARERIPGSVGPVLHRLFQSAMAVGGRVRTETRIGEGAASVPSAATRLAEKVFGSLRGRVAMVLGAGEMGKLTLACLVREGVEGALVASRTLERAERVARSVGARAVPIEEFWGAFGRVDIVVTSTGSPSPILSARRVRAARGSVGRPLVVLDIALPRDVEPDVGRVPGVFLYNVDDLQRVVDSAEAERATELDVARTLIAEHAEAFWRWYRAREAIPLIRQLRSAAEAMRRAEIEEVLREMDSLAEEDRERIHRATRQLLAKLLHAPTVALRRLAADPDGLEALDVAKRLFQLDGGEGRGGG